MSEQKFSKYERARIIGARGLQVSMDAPILLKLKEAELSEMNFDPLKIAEAELDSGVLPISVKQPMPERKEEDIEKLKIEKSKISDAEKERTEREETEELSKREDMRESGEESEEEEVAQAPAEVGV